MLTLIQCLFHPPVTAVACKRPLSSCQKCRWQVTPKHAYTLDQTKSNCGLTIPLCRHSVGTKLETSSHTTHQGTLARLFQFAEPLWTDPGLRSGISVHNFISSKKMNSQTFSQNLGKRKATTNLILSTKERKEIMRFVLIKV